MSESVTGEEEDFDSQDLRSLLLEPYPGIGSITHTHPAPFSPGGRPFRKLLSHKQRIEEAYTAHELETRKNWKSQEESESARADNPDPFRDERRDLETLHGQRNTLMVSDSVVNEAPMEASDDYLVSYELLVDIVSEDFDGEEAEQRRKTYRLLGSLL